MGHTLRAVSQNVGSGSAANSAITFYRLGVKLISPLSSICMHPGVNRRLFGCDAKKAAQQSLRSNFPNFRTNGKSHIPFRHQSRCFSLVVRRSGGLLIVRDRCIEEVSNVVYRAFGPIH